jgi:hypothetical protein
MVGSSTLAPLTLILLFCVKNVEIFTPENNNYKLYIYIYIYWKQQTYSFCEGKKNREYFI